jgi:hypothetical protein
MSQRSVPRADQLDARAVRRLKELLGRLPDHSR